MPEKHKKAPFSMSKNFRFCVNDGFFKKLPMYQSLSNIQISIFPDQTIKKQIPLDTRKGEKRRALHPLTYSF